MVGYGIKVIDEIMHNTRNIAKTKEQFRAGVLWRKATA